MAPLAAFALVLDGALHNYDPRKLEEVIVQQGLPPNHGPSYRITGNKSIKEAEEKIFRKAADESPREDWSPSSPLDSLGWVRSNMPFGRKKEEGDKRGEGLEREEGNKSKSSLGQDGRGGRGPPTLPRK